MIKKYGFNEVLLILWFVFAIFCIFITMADETDGFIPVQEISREISKKDIDLINENFRNVNQLKQDRNFQVFTDSPTVSTMPQQGIIIVNFSANNKKLYVRVADDFYYTNLTKLP